MKPLEALDSAIAFGMHQGGAWPHDGIKHYLRTGKEIPERMLPGGIIKLASPEAREALSRLTSRAAANVPPWIVKQYVG